MSESLLPNVHPACNKCRAEHLTRPFSTQRPRGRWIRQTPNRRDLVFSARAGSDLLQQPAYPIPQSADQVAQQALGACQRAFQDGVRRQQLELLLPLIGATDLDEWPGGIRQQFKAVLPMVESILKGLKETPQLQGPLDVSIWDQGDAVGAWIGEKLMAVVFPTPETLPKATEAAGVDADEGKLALLINPQWRSGQVVHDFGFGNKRRDSDRFMSSFQDVYYLRQQRIRGDEIFVLRSYPGLWQIHLKQARGKDELVHSQESKPSYKELEAILKDVQGSNSSQSWAQRLKSEFAFNRDSVK